MYLIKLQSQADDEIRRKRAQLHDLKFNRPRTSSDPQAHNKACLILVIHKTANIVYRFLLITDNCIILQF